MIVDIFVYENAHSPILNSVDGSWIFVNDEHPLKQLFPIDVTPSGIVIVEIPVPEYIDVSNGLIDDGSWIFVNDLHPQKQIIPIEVNPSGIMIVDIFVCENAYLPILNSVDGSWILVNDEHLSKQ